MYESLLVRACFKAPQGALATPGPEVRSPTVSAAGLAAVRGSSQAALPVVSLRGALSQAPLSRPRAALICSQASRPEISATASPKDGRGGRCERNRGRPGLRDAAGPHTTVLTMRDAGAQQDRQQERTPQDRAQLRGAAAARIAAARPGGAISEIRVASGTSLFRCGAEAIRVAAPGRSDIDSWDLVTLARLYAAAGVPVPEPTAPAARTPEGDEATVWEWVDNDPAAPFPYRQVGQILRVLHSIPLSAVEQALGRLPPYLPDAVGGWISGRMPALSAGAHRFGFAPGELESRVSSAVRAAGEACAKEGQALLHGDVSPSNVLHGRGDVRLCDFEACLRGPWVWDLVNTHIQVASGRADAEGMRELISGYGAGPAESPSWGPLCVLRAIDIATFTMHEALLGSEAGSEAPEWAGWMRAGFPGLASSAQSGAEAGVAGVSR